jgi:ribonucleotide reductase alpha subunit
MYFYAWKKGLKTTYYLRSRPATRITQTTVAVEEQGARHKEQGDMAPVSASVLALTELAFSTPSPHGGRVQGEGSPGISPVRGELVEPQPRAIRTPDTVDAGALFGEVILRQPQDERPEPPSTPVARPLTLFDIPVFAIDPTPASEAHAYTDAEAVACSLENPEYCEACQ